jgi:nitrate reductase NapE component
VLALISVGMVIWGYLAFLIVEGPPGPRGRR